MAEPPFDLAQAQRWFAVEFNNLAWELVEAAERTAVDEERMIHAAHAACLHWLAAGNLVNQLRAQCLLATAYARANLPESAVRHAERSLALSAEAGITQTPFDRATTHGCAATAYRLAGRSAAAREQFRLARGAAEQLTDPDDLALFTRLYLEG